MSEQYEFIDYYSLLGVDYGAETAEIKKAFLQRAKESHPDAGGSNEDMQQINIAYKTLTTPIKREAYDKLYGMHNRIGIDDLELKEDGYTIPTTNVNESGLEDFFVDQLYSEYYDSKKKPKWKNKFKR